MHARARARVKMKTKFAMHIVNPPHISDQCPLTVHARINGPPPGRPGERPVTVHPPHLHANSMEKGKLGASNCPNNRPPPGRPSGRPVTDQGGHLYGGGLFGTGMLIYPLHVVISESRRLFGRPLWATGGGFRLPLRFRMSLAAYVGVGGFWAFTSALL